jgi:inosine/guanosine/xanthosine phosphorylase family protein
MVQKNSLEAYQQALQKLGAQTPAAHVVLGSGFGTSLDALAPETWEKLGDIGFGAVPGLLESSVQDHAGRYRLYKHKPSGKIAQFQMGRLHGYEGHEPRAVVQTVMIPRLAGVENFILTNAAGGLKPAMAPGDVMIIEDHVNLTGRNPLIGHNPKGLDGKDLGPRFPDMGNCYRPEWRARLQHHLEQQNVRTHKGVYLGVLGPTFETHAEVRLYANWGMGSVGMSTVWETIVLHHSGAKVAGLSLISNLGAGLSDLQLDHETILETCRTSAAQVMQGISNFLTVDLFR